MYNAFTHHALNDAQPVPEQRSAAPSQLPPSLQTKHDILRYGISLGSVCICCPGRAIYQLPVHLLTARTGEAEKFLI